MTSPTARAASLAAHLTALTGSQADVGRDPETGAPTVHVRLSDSMTDRVWQQVRLSLIALPPMDEFGSQRETDGTARLWVTLHDPADT